MARVLDRGVLAGVLLLAVLVVVNAAGSYWNTRKVRDNGWRIAHTHEVIAAAEGFRADMRDMEAHQRNFILTGDEQTLGPFHLSEAGARDQLARLRTLTADNPAQQTRLATLESTREKAARQLNVTIQLRREQGMEAARQVVVAGVSRRLLDEADREIGELEQAEHTLLRERTVHLGEAYSNAVFFGAASTGFGLAAVGLFLSLLRRSVRTRQLAAAAVNEQREWFRTMLASIGDAVIATDNSGAVTFLNPVAESLTGWTTAEAAGRSLTDVFHIVNETTRKSVENPAIRALKEGVIVGLANHTILMAKDGSEHPIDDCAAPIRDESGRIGGAVLVFRDISARKEAEADRTRLAAIVESSDDAIIDKTLDGVIRYWNTGAERVFGHTAAEAVGQSITLIIPPDRMEEEREILDRLRRGERIDHFETVRLRKDGRRADISLTVSPILDGEGDIIGASKVARDVTERKRAEESLRESEERHRFLAHLAAATQSLVDSDAIMGVIARLLAEHLDVDRCAYAEIEDEKVFVITGDHSRGVPGIVGRWPVAAFGTECARLMLANEPYVVTDTDTDPRVSVSDLPAYRATTIRAVICVPLHKSGRFTAAMAVHQKTSRDWTPAEIGLVTAVVGRCWEALELSRVTRTLRESEARFRAIVEATPECVKVVSPDGTLLQMNKAGLAMVEGDESAFGQCVYDFVAPEFQAGFRAFNERICRGERGTLEFDIIGLRGTRRHMETNAVPLPTPGGGFAHLAVTRDVTDRKRSEALLREKEERLKLLVDQSRDYAVIVTDRQGVIVDWGGGAEAITGFSASEMIGAAADVIFTPEDREAGVPSREMAEAARDGRAEDKRWHLKKDGGQFFADGVMVPLRDDDDTLRGFGKVFRDATARKRAEDSVRFLAEASASLAELVDYESTLQRIASLAVGGFADWCVVDVLDDEGKRRRLAVTTGSGDVISQAEEGIIPHVLRTGEPEVVFDLMEVDPAATPQGPDRINRLRARGVRSYLSVPLLSRGRVIGGMTFLSRSVRRRFGSEELRVGRDLAGRVTTAIENARLYRDLQEQDRRKDEFLATLAHELRNPLAPIRNGVQVLRSGHQDADTFERMLGMMDRQLVHMVRLVDDLLDVSRVSSGKVVLRKEIVELRAITEIAVETTRQAIEAGGHEFVIRLPDEPISFDADRTRLAQVFANLLNNAAKYTPPGGRIELSAMRENSHAVIRVSDTGVGIPAEMLPKIFDMFTQVGTSLERSQGGLGIGLTLVRRLVEMHGGAVSAESPGPGKGSTFAIRLPVSETPARMSDHTPADAGTAAATKLRILVVDDNRDSADSLALLLSMKNHEMRTAYDGPEALRILGAYRPDLILLDIGLPGMNGYEVAARIRESQELHGVMLVALTGWGQEEDRRRSKAAGFDHHLVKPADPSTVEQILNELSGR